MFTALQLIVFYDGAFPAGESLPANSYASTAPPIGAFAFIDGYLPAGTEPPVGNNYNGTAPPIGPFAFFNGWGSIVVTPPTPEVVPGSGGFKRPRGQSAVIHAPLFETILVGYAPEVRAFDDTEQQNALAILLMAN